MGYYRKDTVDVAIIARDPADALTIATPLRRAGLVCETFAGPVKKQFAKAGIPEVFLIRREDGSLHIRDGSLPHQALVTGDVVTAAFDAMKNGVVPEWPVGEWDQAVEAGIRATEETGSNCTVPPLT